MGGGGFDGIIPPCRAPLPLNFAYDKAVEGRVPRLRLAWAKGGACAREEGCNNILFVVHNRCSYRNVGWVMGRSPPLAAFTGF